MNKKEFIGDLANELAEKGETMDFKQVASTLNASGYKTSYNENYQGLRGTATLISKAWKYFDKKQDAYTANNIATVFKDLNGNCPWDF